MRRKERIKVLETRLRILKKEVYCINKNGDFHARHNKKFKSYVDIVHELEKISIKWKIKKIIRRIKKLWQK